MSEKLGPLTYGAKEEEIFLGREITRHRDFREDTANVIDDEVKKIVSSCMKRAEKILSENIDKLHRLANALLEREILDGDEIDKIIRGETLPPIERKNGNGQTVSVPQVNTPATESGPSGGPSNGAQGEDKVAKTRQRSKK
jgi:cell division protease FtsH